MLFRSSKHRLGGLGAAAAGLCGWRGGVVGPVSVGRGRLTSVPADSLSSPSRTSRGRDRRRLNITVRPNDAITWVTLLNSVLLVLEADIESDE